MTSITVGSREVSICRKQMRVSDLKFYEDNPRVYSIVHTDEDNEPDQESIQVALEKMDHVKQLIQAIRQNGGLTDPLLVMGSDNSVLEGNSRLAAYHVLLRQNPMKWQYVKCDVVTDKIDKGDVTTLLSSYHIIGRKSWDPFEQAGMFWRWKQENVDLSDISKRVEGMGISAKKIRSWIEVYDLMVKNHETKPSRWSHYDELLKNRHTKRAMEEDPKFAKVVVGMIRNGEIERAVDVRDKVTKIARAGGKVLRKFVDKDKDLDGCYEEAVTRGATNVFYNKLHKFREVVCSPEVTEEVEEMTPGVKLKCVFELKRIKTRIARLLDTLT
jgi:hypothetical protein